MATFESGIVQVTGTVGTVPVMVWNPSSTSTTTYGPLGSVPAASVFAGLVVANTGSNTVYLSSGSVATGTAFPVGQAVAAGSECYLSGYAGTVGTAGTVWAQTGALSTTSSVTVGMPSVASVI